MTLKEMFDQFHAGPVAATLRNWATSGGFTVERADGEDDTALIAYDAGRLAAYARLRDSGIYELCVALAGRQDHTERAASADVAGVTLRKLLTKHRAEKV